MNLQEAFRIVLANARAVSNTTKDLEALHIVEEAIREEWDDDGEEI